MVRVNINLDRLDAKRGGVRSILVDSSTKFLGLNTYQVQVVQQSSWVYMGHSWVTLYAWWSSDSQAHPYRNSLKWHKMGGVLRTRLGQSVIKTFVHTWPVILVLTLSFISLHRWRLTCGSVKDAGKWLHMWNVEISSSAE